MSKKNDKNNQPPSLFDNLDLFAAAPTTPASPAPAEPKKSPEPAAPKKKAAAAAEPPPPPPPATPAPPASGSLTGHGPLRELYDYNFREYSAYVICNRAIPSVEDGLKPVQRRILHSLWEKDDGRFTKVANIVGHTMQYHPHGDASIGDALVVLANKLWGKGKGYLIEGQGNFGDLFTGMPSAAPRYIECRLAELARKEVFNPKTTEFTPSYDGRNKEPVLLPAKIPVLLMLGADGIAVGLSTAILPHNFVELLEAEINLIQKKPIQLYPDFQLGGVMDVSEYEDGLGKVKVRAVIEARDKNKLVITQLPWGETTDSISTSIEEAIKKKKVAVRKIHDLTSSDVQIELELATGATQEKVKSALYAFTTCEKSIASRPIVLDAGRPRLMTITQILQKNVDRLMFLTKREQEIRLAELDKLFHDRTLDRIFIEERIYKRIEIEKTFEGVQATIREGFKPFLHELRHPEISDEDIERLLKIPIRRISQFDINKNREEIENIRKEEDQVNDNLVHLRAFVVKYLKNLIKIYGKKYPRVTKIVQGAFQEVDVRKLTSSELTIKYDKENHFVGSGLKGGDELFKCSSLDKLVFVWKDGRYKMTPPSDKIFVDKDLLEVFLFNPEKDRDREFVCVYEEPLYGFSYIKRFTFGGMINNKDYRLAPEKSKVLFFDEGCPPQLYVKFKPAKNQKIHQMLFQPLELVEKGLDEKGKPKKCPVVEVRGATARGIQLTTKAISRVSATKGTWWEENEVSTKGVLL
ncbi:MAG: DNA topoisomerase IV subunit A [Kiritimatiellae bacterium]|nr:DNA topoisomerase IV subunit A [Kiritimatiellia bacterium]